MDEQEECGLRVEDDQGLRMTLRIEDCGFRIEEHKDDVEDENSVLRIEAEA